MGIDDSSLAGNAARRNVPTDVDSEPKAISASESLTIAGTAWHRVLRTLKRPSLSLFDALAIIAVVALATLVRVALDPFLRDRAPFAIFMVAIVFVALFRGLWPSLVTVVVSTLLANYLFIEPRYSFVNEGLDYEIAEVLNFCMGIVIALCCEALRAAAQENARLFQLARESEIHKDAFLAMVSHELRNPLSPIRNALYVLSQIECQQAQVVEMHDLIERQVIHMIRLVDDLLDVSRLTRDMIRLRKESVSLALLVNGAVESIQPFVAEKNQHLSVVLPPLPVQLYGDPVRLVQVFANLLSNAAKYTNSGGHIWFSAELAKDEIVVRIRDDGIGIAPDCLGRIFGLFEQAAVAPGAERGGLGIGLAVVRKIVESHHGSVEAHSPGVGLGSEFVVRIPIEAAAERSTHETDAGDIKLASAPVRTRRILVVDDEKSCANSLATVLKLWNHEVRIAFDGFSALEIANTFKPQVVLADLGLPRMSGYALAKQLRRIACQDRMFLIAVTGYGQPTDVAMAREFGFDQHLLKPLDPNELEELLRNGPDESTRAAELQR